VVFVLLRVSVMMGEDCRMAELIWIYCVHWVEMNVICVLHSMIKLDCNRRITFHRVLCLC
jgi:hypothetical protein